MASGRKWKDIKAPPSSVIFHLTVSSLTLFFSNKPFWEPNWNISIPSASTMKSKTSEL